VNALKRFESEKQNALHEGSVKAARSFITVMDSLTRAEQAGEVPEAFQSIARQLKEALQALKLSEFGEVGDMFDPSLHEALGQDSVDSAEKDDVITAVLEVGWKAGESVVRPAKVRVGHFEG
jgi:molecular chaperone GrpE